MKSKIGSAWLVLAGVGVFSVGGCSQSGDRGDDLVVGKTEQALGSGPQLIATGVLTQATDLAPFSDALENGLPQNVLGGIGSALTSAGGGLFLAVPDRGPNASTWSPNVGGVVDNTTSFISRFETVSLALSPASSGSLPFTLTAALKDTTLFYSESALTYGTTPGIPSAVPVDNDPSHFYFSGRSDNFSSGDPLNPNNSLDPDFARLDPEGIVVSSDGNSIFTADEYGPFVYQFDRLTGRRIRTFSLPAYFAIPNLNSVGALEISGNNIGRVTNKGMEGLAITPDGSTLVALVQSPLIQDGGDGGFANRIVTIDIASGATHEYVYNNGIVVGTAKPKAFNSSEILALNNHQFLIDTRDGKGLGDGSVAVVKQLWAVDIAGAQDVSGMSGAATLLPYAVAKTRFLDIVAVLNANGFASTQIPAKIEGLALGADVVLNGVVTHTLYIANDNDFVPDVAGSNRWFVFGFTDDDLAALGLSLTPHSVTERGPDLALTHTASAASVVTGGSVSYTLTATNSGIVTARNASITDVIPAGLEVTSCSAPASCQVLPGTTTLTLGSVAGAASQSATVDATVSCALADGTTIATSAVASFDDSDPTPADDSATATITAVNPAPSISSVGVSKSVLWPANNSMVPITVSYGVTDNCAGTVCTLSVASNLPISEYGSDWQIVDANHVLLRANRVGGQDRTYSIAISCQDSGGAVSTASTSVAVRKP